ncbi:MAG TPA: beta-propeller fold lactonase family protein [Myxococcales bacterium]|jgi:YVTN family beta-propeller protein|nr:beta-propeller fold lactonase family protein [Myxococcales bacterium]
MSRLPLLAAAATALCLLLTGCPPPGPTGDDGGQDAGVVLKRASRSSAIAITTDDAIVAAVSPDTDQVAFMSTASKTVSSSVTFAAGSMPVSVAIHPDDATAFVVLRKAQKLAKVTGINTLTPAAAATADVGSEPTAVAITPTGATALVANYGEGTVSVIETETMTVKATIQVGGAPRAISITNDGDGNDGNETAWVTLFFGAARGAAPEAVDDGREGKLVEISLSTLAAGSTVTLSPIATGVGPALSDGGTGAPVGCAPNQLFNVALNNGKGYVTHVCAAPQPPIFKFTNVFAGVSVVDLGNKAEDVSTTGTVALNKLVDDQSTKSGLLLGVPVEMDFRMGTNVAYVVSQSADVVQRVNYSGDVAKPIGLGPNAGFAQIDIRGTTGTKVPIGIVVAHSRQNAYVDNWADRSISVIDLALQSVDGTPVPIASKPAAGTPEASVLNGEKFFFTGTGRWADRGVSSCGSCHPDGLSDGITWVFAAGPRQTTPLDGTFSKTDPTDQRALNWTAIFDELHDFELNTRGTSGGKGAITEGTVPNDTAFRLADGVQLDVTRPETRNDFLSGSTKEVVKVKASVKDWDDIEAYVKKIHANKAPRSQDAAAVGRGRTLFTDNNCHQCHGGAKWSVSRVPFTPSPEKNGSAVGSAPPAGNSLPATASGLRTQALAGGAYPIAGINIDTMKVDVERVPNPGGSPIPVGPERITCVLRSVGTYDVADPVEKKADGTRAQGANGFNPPSLLGLRTSAPYFHHGEARTLTDVFLPRFNKHHQALSANFLINNGTTAQEQAQIADLVAFLESIDESTAAIPVSSTFDICGNY